MLFNPQEIATDDRNMLDCPQEVRRDLDMKYLARRGYTNYEHMRLAPFSS